MKTAVLIHGYHLQADDWEQLVWGSTGTYAGVIPCGITLAWKEQATLISWGTGASERDGLKECEVMYRYALEHLPELASHLGVDEEKLRLFVEERSHFDTTSQVTTEEVRACMTLCVEQGIERLFVVPASTHASRSIAVVLIIGAEAPFEALLAETYVAPARAGFSSGGADTVCVLEPPHRGDLQKPDPAQYPNILGRRVVSLMKREQEYLKFLIEWDELLKRFNA